MCSITRICIHKKLTLYYCSIMLLNKLIRLKSLILLCNTIGTQTFFSFCELVSCVRQPLRSETYSNLSAELSVSSVSQPVSQANSKLLQIKYFRFPFLCRQHSSWGSKILQIVNQKHEKQYLEAHLFIYF